MYREDKVDEGLNNVDLYRKDRRTNRLKNKWRDKKQMDGDKEDKTPEDYDDDEE